MAIVIISYNTREMTLACLRSVYEQMEGLDAEVIVVDNASTDDSAGAIERAFPEVTLHALDENLGFAAANNFAVEHCDSEYILLLNPDTVVLDRAIQKLMAFAKQTPEAGIWGGRTVFADGSLNPASCWRRATLWGMVCRTFGLVALWPDSPIFNPQSYGGWKRDTVREVDIVTGCLLLITRELWERLDGFDAAFFMYGEEADLCLRARALGCRPLITPESTIIHYGGASERVPADRIVRLMRSQALLIRRHWSPWTAPLGIALLRLCALNRGLCGGLPAALVPAGLRERSTTWRDVWRRRREWQTAT